MSDTISDYKTISKNIILLYARTIITVLISLFTSRIILNTLGVENFGVYVVVYSIVGFLSFFPNTLSATSKRFLSFSIGEGNKQKLKETFGSLLTLHLLISIVLVFILEIIGIWFLNNHLVIPQEKLYEAKIIFQFSVATFFVSINSSLFLSSLISFEKFNLYAYISIYSILLKLLLVYLLLNFNYNKLLLFASFIMIQEIILNLSYVGFALYSIKNIELKYIWNKSIIKKIYDYSSWTFYGLFIMIVSHHSMVFILNSFFGPIINGSLGMARQLTDLINLLKSNFNLAITPAITKSYASSKIDNYESLVFKGSKFSFFLMLLVLIPLIFEIDFVLTFWLGNYPIYCEYFVVLILINHLFDSLVNPIDEYVNSRGKIKRYNLIIYSYIFLILPFSTLLIYLGYPPYYIFFVNIFFTLTSLYLRLYLAKKFYNFKRKKYFTSVVFKVLNVTGLTLLLPLIIYVFVDASVYRFFITCSLTSISSLFIIYKVGLDNLEKELIINQIFKRIKS